VWPCSAPFKEEVGAWIGKLATVSEAIEGWLAVQAMWSYMEAVFSGGDIVKQLPAEAKRFQNIDKGYMKVSSAFVSRVCQCNRQPKGEIEGHGRRMILTPEGLTTAFHHLCGGMANNRSL